MFDASITGAFGEKETSSNTFWQTSQPTLPPDPSDPSPFPHTGPTPCDQPVESEPEEDEDEA